MKKKMIIVLVSIFVLHLCFRIYEYRNSYLTQYDSGFWKNRYDKSQWSTKPACRDQNPHVNPYTCVWDDVWYAHHQNDKNAQYLKKSVIGDDLVYTYAGWEYIHGHDPTTLNAELPPFGKYLIGFSEVFFHNQNIFALLAGLFALGAFYLLNTRLFKERLFAFIPVLLLSLEPLFYTMLNTALLDTLYLGLACMTFYFFLGKKYIPSFIFLGLMAATKATIATFPLMAGVMFLYLLISKQKKEYKKYLLRLPIAFIVFTLTYIKYFLLGHSLREFLGVQKWIVNFYSEGVKGSPIIPWEILFTGHWHTWWDTYETVKEWHVGWVLIFFIALSAVITIIKKRYTNPITLVAIWIVSYFAFLCLIPTWPRYLLLILPFLYTLAVWIVTEKKLIKF